MSGKRRHSPPAAAASSAGRTAKRRKENDAASQPAAAASAIKLATQTDVQRSVSAFINAHRNRNTHESYMRAWSQFERWAREIANPTRTRGARIDSERPTENDVAQYCQYLAEDRGCAMSTVSIALAAIKDHLASDEDPDYHPWASLTVRRMMAALAPRAKPSKQTKELSGDIVAMVVDAAMDANTTVGMRDACMIELAYQALLRSSEVVRMDVSDISFTTERIQDEDCDVMRVHVNRLSKNDANRKGHERLIRGDGTATCLVRRMREYIATMEDSPPSTVLFPMKENRRLSPATPPHRLRHWLEACGEDPQRYTFHSLRAGGATDAVHAGVPERIIKAHGNWTSNIVHRYLREDTEDRLATSRALARKPAVAAEH